MAGYKEMRSLTSAFKRVKLTPSSHAFSTYGRLPALTTDATPRQILSEALPSLDQETMKSTVERLASQNPSNPDATGESSNIMAVEILKGRNSDLSTSSKGPKPLPLSRSLHAMYLRPLRRAPTAGQKVCDLQLRSYSVRNLEFFADFAMRAAYYLNMPARGPIPLPRLTESWTVPRSNFIFKKSQENYRRITLRRLIQIQDADPETVQIWLGYLERRQFYGVGMKANVYEWDGLEVGKELDERAAATEAKMGAAWENFGTRKSASTPERLAKLLSDEVFERAPRDMEALIREPKEIRRER